MSNERLRSAMLAKKISISDLATEIEVDPKTVERWITKGKIPYRRHQYAAASILDMDASALWSDTRTTETAAELSKAEIVTVYPHRHVVPADLWREMCERATECIDILVYAGIYLAEDPQFLDTLKAKAKSLRVRVLMGEPGCEAVIRRGIDEGHRIMDGKIRNALHNYRPLFTSHPEIEFRLHDTVLYNSIYRADDEMLANTHVYGLGAYQAPVLHLRRLPGGTLFDTFANSVQQTWEGARPITEHDITGA
ncbi:XRE family transcriptional regulator [Streptomyces sp. NPDC051940]|uniref:XRE family transcriptional regulator n=1 Tax=Streptomyces sp. NPDC051940 TaxID=3155675 RepID=UPI00343D0396